MNPQPAAFLALGLAACSGQGGGGNGGQAAGTIAMRPGWWETTMRVLAIDSPNAPPELMDGLRTGISMAPVTDRSCMTPAQSANPAEAMRVRALPNQQASGCETGEALFANGRIRMLITCHMPNGQPAMRQAMVGSYSADRIQMAVSAQTSMPGNDLSPAFRVRIESEMTGRRLGDCPAGQAN